MTVTLNEPLANSPMGVGFAFSGATNILGPFPNTWFWQGKLMSSGPREAQLVYGRVGNPTGSSFAGILGYQNEPGTSIFRPTPGIFPVDPLAVNETWRFVAELVRADGLIEDQTSVPVQLDMQTGLATYINDRTDVVATGGFTEADRANLQIVKMGVTFDLGDGVSRGLAAIASGLPPSFHTRELITPDRSGDGSLQRPGAGLSTLATGLAWQVQTRAPGEGIDEGAPDVLEIPVAQLRYVLTLADGFQFTSDHVTTVELQGAWLWNWVMPTRIDYWIQPGLTVRFWWLVPTFPLIPKTQDGLISDLLRGFGRD